MISTVDHICMKYPATIIETMKARATLESVEATSEPIAGRSGNSRKHMPKLTVIKTPVPWIFTI